MFKFEDDPFKSDNEGFNSSYYKDLIDKEESKSHRFADEVIEAEVIDDTPDEADIPKPSKVDDPFLEEERRERGQSDSMKLLTGNTKNFRETVDNMLDLSKVGGDQQLDAAKTFRQLFDDLNHTYGLDIKFSFDSFTRNLSYMISPKNLKAAECYLSESYSRIRVTLYLMYMNAVTVISSKLLDPKFLTSNSMPYSDMLIMMRELFTYMQSLDEIYERIKVKDSDVRLRKIAEETEEDNQMNNDDVRDFLNLLLDNVKQGK